MLPGNRAWGWWLCTDGSLSTTANSTSNPALLPAPKRRIRGVGLWDRISEGKELGDLWAQFSADAQAKNLVFTARMWTGRASANFHAGDVRDR